MSVRIIDRFFHTASIFCRMEFFQLRYGLLKCCGEFIIKLRHSFVVFSNPDLRQFSISVQVSYKPSLSVDLEEIMRVDGIALLDDQLVFWVGEVLQLWEFIQFILVCVE